MRHGSPSRGVGGPTLLAMTVLLRAAVPSTARARRPREGLRFMAVGASSTALTVVVFNLLVHLGDHPLLADRPVTAYVVGMVVGTAYSFTANRTWVFATPAGTPWLRDLVAFAGVNLAATTIPVLCLAASRYGLDLRSVAADNVAANLVGLLAATWFRYWAYRTLVFARPATV